MPIDLGTHDQWEAATMGWENIGPNYWKGEDGRKALIAGKQKLTDADWVAPFKEMAKWMPYMGDGYQSQTYSDSQNLFSLGKAAIYPAGSWDIPTFEKANPDLKFAAFPPPVQKAGDKCYISDQLDHARGHQRREQEPRRRQDLRDLDGRRRVRQLPMPTRCRASSPSPATRSRSPIRWPRSS